MTRYALLLSVFITLILSPALADGNLDIARRQLEKHDSYALNLTGRDEDGEYSATYLYTPEVQVLRRKDRTGTSTYLYDKAKRPDKVMVTRGEAAYMYSLDNPGLPSFVPGSLLDFALGSKDKLSVETGSDGTVTSVSVGDYTEEEGMGMKLSDIRFDPDMENTSLARIANYLR